MLMVMIVFFETKGKNIGLLMMIVFFVVKPGQEYIIRMTMVTVLMMMIVFVQANDRI